MKTFLKFGAATTQSISNSDVILRLLLYQNLLLMILYQSECPENITHKHQGKAKTAQQKRQSQTLPDKFER
jgi:hypothetical protein